MDISPVSFGNWAKRRRRMLDLTQKELAQRAGCSVAALQKIERDERRPSRQLAERLADFLEVPPDQRALLLRVARRERMAEALPSIPQPAAPPLKESTPKHSRSEIPIPPTPLVGREVELAEIARLLHDPQCRLLTLRGAGGIGKTRLALEAARRLQGDMPQGAYFVSLVGISAPEFIVPTIADALGFGMSGSIVQMSQLLNYLKEKQTLIVLDNFEHLLDGAELLSEILQHAPGIKLLVTSRELLHLQAEWMLEVHGLFVPQNAWINELEASSSAMLFLQRAQQARVGFTLTDVERSALLRICQLVQGMPLAIELAAAWVRTLSCRQIADEIEQGLGFLAATARDVPERHRSITAVFDQSWKLLATEEQRVLRQLSIFRGSFTRRAAKRVAGASLPLLSALVDKSLVQYNDIYGGRFELHELIRQYAAVRLEEAVAEEQATRERHSRYYLTLLVEQEPALRSRQQKETLSRLIADIDNLRMAWDFAISGEVVDLLRQAAGPLYYFYELLQYFREAESSYKRAADMLRTRLANCKEQKDPELEVALGDMLNYQAFFNLRPGNNREALALFQTSMELLSPLHETYALTFALVHAGVVHWAMGNFDEASLALSKSLSMSSTLTHHPWLRAFAVGFLGAVTHDMGGYADGYRLLSEAMTICRDMEDPYFILLIGSYFTRSAQAQGHIDEAHKVLREGLQIARENGNRWSIGLALERLGTFMQTAGNNNEAALQYLEESLKLLREVGDRWSLSWVLNAMGQLSLANRDETKAEQYAMEAIKVANEAGNHPSELNALVTLSTIRAQQKLNAPALEMALYVLQHPSSTQEAKDRAVRLRLELEARLTPYEVKIAQTRIQSDPNMVTSTFSFNTSMPA
ncbi:Putative HTH-type transcriptional regulator [Anaerolineales bacterium]|nr:Putative HTH-type transcriptional regulator [Anaerolineales bacterium]